MGRQLLLPPVKASLCSFTQGYDLLAPTYHQTDLAQLIHLGCLGCDFDLTPKPLPGKMVPAKVPSQLLAEKELS